MTQLGGLPVSAGKGILQGVGGVFKHHKDQGSSSSSSHVIPLSPAKQHKDRDPESSHDIPLTSAYSTVPSAIQEATTTSSFESSLAATKPSIDSNPPPSNEPGTLKVVVVNGSLSDESKAYVVLRVGNKEVKTKHSTKTTHPEWYILSWPLYPSAHICYRNEPFSFSAGPLTEKLHIWLHEHKSLVKDKDLGDAEIDVCHPNRCSR